MKKRLSLLLATLMVVSMLPVSAFAAGKPVSLTQNATNESTQANKQVEMKVAFEFEKKDPVSVKLAAQNLRLQLTNGAVFTEKWDDNGDQETAPTPTPLVDYTPSVEWDGADAVLDGVVIKQVGDTLFFTNTGEENFKAAGKSTLTFTFRVDFSKASEGNVDLVVTDANGTLAAGVDTVGSQTFRVATVKEAVTDTLAMTAKDPAKTISFDGGQLSQFEIKNFSEVTKAANRELYLEIDDALELDTDKSTVLVDGTTSKLIKKDVAGSAVYQIRAAEIKANSKVIVVIPVFKGMGRDATTGKVNVVARIYDATENKSLDSNRVVVGEIVDYSVTMTVVEKNKKEIPSVWGGEEATVKVTLKGPKGSFLDRTVDFKVEGADVKYETKEGFSGKADPKNAEIFRNGEFSYAPKGKKLNEETSFSFYIDIVTEGDMDGTATITAAQRGWEVKADLAKVTPKFKAVAELNPIKKGEARDVSEVKITEAKAGLLERGDRLVLTFDTRRDYTRFTSKKITVEATNGMTFDTSASAMEFIPGEDTGAKVGLVIPITKASSGEPAVITVKGLNVSVDGSATEDTIKVIAGILPKGKAIEPKQLVSVSKAEYIKVVKEYALESITTVFTIGQTQYTKNGQAMTVASAPYIKNGRTMLPIRAVAESLGLAVQWNGATKTATFSDATKVAAVTIGAEKMFVNGTPVPLAAKAELVNGTTFVELRSLSTAFGVQIDWDAAAKTATVSK